MEATRGNGYAPAWGSLVMMMMVIGIILSSVHPSVTLCIVAKQYIIEVELRTRTKVSEQVNSKSQTTKTIKGKGKGRV